MSNDILPEEKLLRLIRTPKSKEPALAKGKKDALTRRPLYRSFNRYFSFLDFNKVIYFLLILSFIFLLATFIYPLISPKEIKIPQAGDLGREDLDIQEGGEIKPFEFYKDIQDKDLFSSPLTPPPEQPKVVSSDIIKDIVLVGIISGERPQAIIEDKKLAKTYYVYKGQYVNELLVDDIQEGKVILEFAGQKFELHL